LGQITISDDMAKLLNSIRAIGTGRSTNADESSPFRLQPLEKPYDFEETVQEKYVLYIIYLLINVYLIHL